MGKYIRIRHLNSDVRNLMIQTALGYIGRQHGKDIAGKQHPIRKGEKFICQKLAKEGETITVKEIKTLYRSNEKGILSPFFGKQIKIPYSTNKILETIIEEAKVISNLRTACKKFCDRKPTQFTPNKCLYRDILVGEQYELLDIHISNGSLEADEKAMILFNQLSKIIETLED